MSTTRGHFGPYWLQGDYFTLVVAHHIGQHAIKRRYSAVGTLHTHEADTVVENLCKGSQ